MADSIWVGFVGRMPYHKNSVDNSTVFVKSNIPEKHKLKKDRFVQKHLFDVTCLDISFKDSTLANAGIYVNFSEKDNYDKGNDVYVDSQDYKLLDSLTVGSYMAKVWSASSQNPAFKYYDKDFKVIYVWTATQGIYMQVANISNFRDNITPQFIIQKLTELEFTVKPKN